MMAKTMTFAGHQQAGDAMQSNETGNDLGILAIRDGVNTARYFENAAVAAHWSVQKIQDVSCSWSEDKFAALLVVDPCLTASLALKSVRCPVIGYLIDVHQQLDVRLAYARYFDHVFVAQLDYLQVFRDLPHPSVHWLPLACDPAVHFVQGLDRDIDVGFVGKLGMPGSARFETLSCVLSEFATNDFTRPYTPAEMGEVYSRSRIVFNKSINGDVNMRVLEGLASGALLVTDRIDNGLDQIGIAGVHFVTYDTIDEAVDVIRHYLANDLDREAIAKRGQAHVFSHHTYAHRLAEILATVEVNPDARAPARAASAKTEATWRSECMRIQGASVSAVAALAMEGNLTQALIANSAIALARGVVRPMRQRLRALLKTFT